METLLKEQPHPKDRNRVDNNSPYKLTFGKMERPDLNELEGVGCIAEDIKELSKTRSSIELRTKLQLEEQGRMKWLSGEQDSRTRSPHSPVKITQSNTSYQRVDKPKFETQHKVQVRDKKPNTNDKPISFHLNLSNTQGTSKLPLSRQEQERTKKVEQRIVEKQPSIEFLRPKQETRQPQFKDMEESEVLRDTRFDIERLANKITGAMTPRYRTPKTVKKPLIFSRPDDSNLDFGEQITPNKRKISPLLRPQRRGQDY
eukprot:TRINITY_DN13820_c0_g1_i1.p1 TRINITY_DN13820_c0_g1~~TRINITY_DN13820_c0_g1_i1.p1  ORF type:complete len:258 (+),score=49.10 TRINITY_DN13820_c0_g1_i1:407-1180(+)